jgi:hypothetical protein
MAKFNQKVAVAATAEEKATMLQNLKNKFSEFKNPLASSNPFSDEEELTFDYLTEVNWTHEKWGSGKYIAIKFVGKKDTLALSSLVKEVNGYATLDTNDNTLKPFKNSGGLHDTMSGGKDWDVQMLDDIIKWFADKGNKCKVKLTTYYISQGSTRKTCTLTNLI